MTDKFLHRGSRGETFTREGFKYVSLAAREANVVGLHIKVNDIGTVDATETSEETLTEKVGKASLLHIPREGDTRFRHSGSEKPRTSRAAPNRGDPGAF